MYPAYISYSSLRTFKECPQRYKFSYIDRIRVEGTSNIYAAFGSAVHLAIKKFYDKGIFTRKALMGLWKPCFNEEMTKQKVEKVSDREYQRLLKQGYPMLQKFYSQQERDGMLVKPIATEFEFKIPCRNKYNKVLTLSGKIDAIFNIDGKIIIVDYKTTANKNYWINDKLDLQLIMYYVAFRLLHKDYKQFNCQVCLHYLRPGIKNYFDVNYDDRKTLFREVYNHLIGVSRSEFRPNPTEYSCRFCVYTHICPANKVKESGIFKKGMKLLPYQKADVSKILQKKTILNGNETGLGKTVEMIFVAEALRKDDKIKNILIVCPGNIKYQWRDEIRKFLSEADINLIDGNRVKRKMLYQQGGFWTIINYELLQKDIEHFPKYWDMIVLDEASAFRHWKTDIAKAIRTLKVNRSTNYKCVLTATPISNNLAELYSIVRFLDYRVLGSRKSFDKRYVKRDYFNRIKEYVNVQELIDRIKPILIRHRVKDVLKDLPPRIIHNVYVDFLPQQQKLYDATVLSIREYLNDKVQKDKKDKVADAVTLSKFMYLREIGDSTKLIGTSNYSAKLNKLKLILKNILPDKVIIFSEFAKMIKIIKDELKCETITVTGADNTKEKVKKIKRFEDSKTINVLLCTDVIKYGMNLQFAHYLIDFDLPFTYSAFEQRIGRERRIGQKNKVIVINLIMNNSCEDRILEILKYKKKLAQIVDDAKYDKIVIPKSSGITNKTLMEILKEKK